MSLELSRLQSLRCGPRGAAIQVGDIPHQAANHLGTGFRTVNLSRESYEKIVRKHYDLKDYDFLQLPFILQHGLWIAETKKLNCLIASCPIPSSELRYKVAVKKSNVGPDLWLIAFHRINPRATTALLKRGPIVRMFTR